MKKLFKKISLRNLVHNYFVYLVIFTIEIIGIIAFSTWKNRQIFTEDILEKTFTELEIATENIAVSIETNFKLNSQRIKNLSNSLVKFGLLDGTGNTDAKKLRGFLRNFCNFDNENISCMSVLSAGGDLMVEEFDCIGKFSNDLRTISTKQVIEHKSPFVIFKKDTLSNEEYCIMHYPVIRNDSLLGIIESVSGTGFLTHFNNMRTLYDSSTNVYIVDNSGNIIFRSDNNRSDNLFRLGTSKKFELDEWKDYLSLNKAIKKNERGNGIFDSAWWLDDNWKKKKILATYVPVELFNSKFTVINSFDYENFIKPYKRSLNYSIVLTFIVIFSVIIFSFIIHRLMKKHISNKTKLQVYEDFNNNAEQVLRSEEKYRNLFNFNGTAICTVGPDEILTDCNSKFLEFTEYERRDVINKLNWKELVAEDDLERVLSYDKARKKNTGDAPEEYTLKIKTKYGKIKHSVITVIVLETTREQIASIVDITEIVEKDKALKENETLLSQAQQIARLGSWSYDTGSGKLNGSNELYSIIGVEENYDNPITIDTLEKELGFADFADIIRKATNSVTGIEREISLKNNSGEKQDADYFMIRAKAVTENDTVIRVVGVIQNITEKKQIETEINRKNKDLKNLLYITSHDLHMPLITIEGFSNMLLKETDPDNLTKEGKHLLERIVYNVKDMSELLNNFFDLSRIRLKGESSDKINTEDVIRQAVNDLEIVNEKYNSEVIISTDHKFPVLYGNRENIRLMFYQIMMNSIIYGGKVIEAGYLPEKGFYVRDDGRGMKNEDTEKIFMPGERLGESEIEGTGMGLTFCKKIIDIHKGTIDVVSQINKGTAVYIKFNT